MPVVLENGQRSPKTLLRAVVARLLERKATRQQLPPPEAIWFRLSQKGVRCFVLGRGQPEADASGETRMREADEAAFCPSVGMISFVRPAPPTPRPDGLGR
jgi:hypothetical protein